MEKKESLRSMSRQLGLSHTTVFRALNSCGNVDPATADLVRRFALEEEYRVPERNKPKCVLVLPAKPECFWGKYRTRLWEMLKDLPIRFFLYSSLTDGNGFRSAFSHACSLNPALAVVAATDRPAIREVLKEASFPIFFASESIPMINSFYFGSDPFADGYALGQAFSSRFPHCRSILCFHSEGSSSLAKQRTEGFRRGAPQLRLIRTHTVECTSKPYAASLLARSLAEAPSFDCVFCDTGILSELCLALNKCRIPPSIPCVGFEDSPALESYRKNGRNLLTSSQNLEGQVELCAKAVRNFLSTSNFPTQKNSVVSSLIT